MPDINHANLEEGPILQPLIQLRELLLLQVGRLITTLEEELEDSVQQEFKHLEVASQDVRRRLNEQRLYTSILVWAHAEITEYDLLLHYAQNDSPQLSDPHNHPLVDTITDILQELTNSTLQSLEESEQDIDHYLVERNGLQRDYITFNSQYLGTTIVDTFENLSSMLEERQKTALTDQIDRAREQLEIMHREIILQSRKIHDKFTERSLGHRKKAQQRSFERIASIRQRLEMASDQDHTSQRVQERLASAAMQAQERFDNVISQSGRRMEEQVNDAFNRYLRHLSHAHAHLLSILKLSGTAFSQTFQACRLLLNAKLQHHATTQENLALTNAVQRDPLTRLHNRLALAEHFPRIHATAIRAGLQLNLLFLDLDGFKAVNDRLGHHAGDLLLQDVAERMRTISREGDMICRLGGDEFIIMATSTGHDDLTVLGQRLVNTLAQPYLLNSSEANISVSIGIAVVRDDDDLKAIIERADEAMYLAKSSGKNCFRLEQPGDQSDL